MIVIKLDKVILLKFWKF